jgi:hypothetical protein
MWYNDREVDKPNGRPVKGGHTPCAFPGLHKAWHYTQLCYSCILHKFSKAMPMWSTIVESHRGPIEKGAKNKVRTHHPSQISWPSKHITISYILVGPSICGASQWGHMCPGYCLWFPCLDDLSETKNHPMKGPPPAVANPLTSHLLE